MTEAGSIELTFDTKQKVAGLEVIARLHASNEFGQAAIQIVAGNVQAAVGPSSTEVGTNIKPSPIIQRCRDWCFVYRSFDRQVGRKSGSAQQSCRDANEENFLHRRLLKVGHNSQTYDQEGL